MSSASTPFSCSASSGRSSAAAGFIADCWAFLETHIVCPPPPPVLHVFHFVLNPIKHWSCAFHTNLQLQFHPSGKTYRKATITQFEIIWLLFLQRPLHLPTNAPTQMWLDLPSTPQRLQLLVCPPESCTAALRSPPPPWRTFNARCNKRLEGAFARSTERLWGHASSSLWRNLTGWEFEKKNYLHYSKQFIKATVWRSGMFLFSRKVHTPPL